MTFATAFWMKYQSIATNPATAPIPIGHHTLFSDRLSVTGVRVVVTWGARTSTNPSSERTGRTEASVHGLHHRGRSVMRRLLAAAGGAPCTVARSSSRTRPETFPRVGAR
ncbi:MAG TPA: hypothetical protein VGV57_08025 [Thermoleophilaceae bacterium]|nr:hypothetical protein [Thermoleophilaceae bacterium]